MFCQKCGTNVADGAAFCPVCGNVMNAAPVAPATPVASAAPVAPAGYDLPVAPQPPQKKKTGLIIGIVVAVILVIAGVVGALFATGVIGKSEEEKIEEIAEETAKKIERGTISGDTYTNESVGITFEKPSDWTYATDEQLAEMLNAGQEVVDFDDMETALSEALTVYDMSAANSNETQMAAVAFMNAEKSEVKGMSEKEYLEQCKSEFENLNSSELSYECGEITEVKLSGKTFSCLELKLNGILYQNMYARIDGDILILVTTVALYSSDLAEIEAMFK